MTDLCDIDHHMGGGCRTGGEDPDGSGIASNRKRPEERAIAALAASQHGVVARRQLLALGFGRRAVDRRLGAGRLHPVHLGVYAVGHPRLSARARWMAAVLAFGPNALLSHRSAAALWGVLPTAGSRVDVSADNCRGRGRPKIALHRVRRIHSDDRALCDGIPVTALARTFLDLAEVVLPRHLERAFEEAERLHLLDLDAIERLSSRSRGRRGLRALGRVAREYRGVVPTRSELERRFLDLCRESQLPFPAVNSLVAGVEVDAVWHDRRLVVELDGHEFHRTRAAFERNRVRDAALQLAGYRVVRVTHRRLESEPNEVLTTVRSLLELKP